MDCAKRYSFWLLLALFMAVFASAISIAQADISYTGNVDPEDPSTWTSSTDVKIGYIPENDVNNGYGSLSIDGGSEIESGYSYIGCGTGSVGAVTIDGSDSSWLACEKLLVGFKGYGSLTITNGGFVEAGSYGSSIGYDVGSTGFASVDGINSQWRILSVNPGSYVDYFYVGYYGTGTLSITNSGCVNTTYSECYIGYKSGSLGEVIVSGEDAVLETWPITVGKNGSGSLKIINGGLVEVDGTLTIDYDENGDSFIYMGSGGTLNLHRFGGTPEVTLSEFFDLIEGTDAILYWCEGDRRWESLTEATQGTDYTLEYIPSSDLGGRFVLTVLTPVPEPGTLALLAGGLLTIAAYVIRKRNIAG